ncbi:MAG: NAD(P)-binding protein [Collinsella sp.]
MPHELPHPADIPAYWRLLTRAATDALNIIIGATPCRSLPAPSARIPAAVPASVRSTSPRAPRFAPALKAAREADRRAAKLRALAIANDGEHNVAVIGGGPAGLATAFFLTRAGVPVTIFEVRDRSAAWSVTSSRVPHCER